VLPFNEIGPELTFLIVITCAAEVVPTFVVAKPKALGETVRPPPAVVEPEKETVGGVPLALVFTVKTAVTEPAAVGSNWIVLVQLAPAASGELQLVAVFANSALPLNVLPFNVIAVLPVFLIVMTSAAETDPTAVAGNV
jgi:hypothetical protein